MPYFNPKPLVFNPDSKVIEASGAIGQSLFEIMKENTKREQENARLAEAKRANLQSEAMKEKQFDFDNTKFDYAKQKDERDFAWDRQKWQTQFNAEQAHRKNQQSLGWANYNLRANELAKQEALRQAEQGRQQEAENLQNMAYFDYGVKNGAFGDIANSPEFANLTPQQKANYGANLKAQMNAQGQIYKANEPLFKMQEQEKARQEALRQEQARNLQVLDIATNRADEFNLSASDLHTINALKQQAQQGDENAQKALYEIGSQISGKIATQNEINKQLGIKSMTADEKRAIARLQTQKTQQELLLQKIDDLIKGDNARGGIDKNSGAWDKWAVYNTPLSEWSDDASARQSEINAVALANQAAQKGMGRYNFEKAEDLLETSGFGSKRSAKNTIAMRQKALDDLEIIANQMIEQGYKGGYELLEKVKNNRINDDELNDYLYAEKPINDNFGYLSTNSSPIEYLKEKAKKKLQYSDRGRTQSYYEQADEHGGHYMQ